MLIEVYQVRVEYTRTSKHNKSHKYFRSHNMALLKCDACGNQFERRVSQMDPRRLNSKYVHVCSGCNPKQFAQSKGVEGRRFWNTTVDLDIDIDKI
jgi:hypothetical protein